MRRIRTTVLVGCLMLAGCREAGHPWPEAVGAAFLASCGARAPRAACECTLAELRRRFTHEAFTALEARTQATGAPPLELQAAANACR